MSICKGQVQDTSGLIQLRERVLNEIKQYPLGQFGIAFKDLQSEATIFINENSAFHAASTMKTPVMAEVFVQAALANSISKTRCLCIIISRVSRMAPNTG